MRIRKHILAGALAAVLGIAAFSASAMAAAASPSLIDTNRSASLTLYKYDLTEAEENGLSLGEAGNGTVNTQVEQSFADYALKGVKFTYYRIADVDMHTQITSPGQAEVKVVYGLDADSLAQLQSLGLDMSKAVKTASGRTYFTSNVLSETLQGALARDEIGTRNALEDYCIAHGSVMTETGASGKTSVNGLALGMYLVAETYVPDNVVSTVNPFLVSLPMTDPTGESWMYDVTVYPKNETGDPTLSKEVAEVTSAAAITYADTATASDGDVLAYRVTSQLPRITSHATYLTEYTFVDTLSPGITYTKNDVTLTWKSGSDQKAVWTQTDATPKFTVSYQTDAGDNEIMTIQMTEAGLAEINPAYSEYNLVIDYRCTLNKDETVVYGDTGNPNEVVLTWRRTNRDYSKTLKDDCIVYTYGLALTKEFQSAGGDPTKAEFVVRNASDGYYIKAVKLKDGVYAADGTIDGTKDTATVFTPDAKGSLTILGLEDDTYYAEEIATAEGYLLLKDEIEIRIVSTAGDHSRVGSAFVNGEETTMAKSGLSANALVPLTVINTLMPKVPLTGDDGLFLIPLFGSMLAFASVGVFLLLRRRYSR